MRTTLPLFGVIGSAVLFGFGAARYPGGYDWLDQSVSSLFQPKALDGTPNSSRLLVVLAVVTFCTSIAIVFNTIARHGPSRFHRKTIQIAGIGSMVYTALVVTPMHDVLVGVALVFFVTVMVAIFHRLYLEQRIGMLCFGFACLALTLCNAIMYYGNLIYEFLPSVQKISLIMWVSWLLRLFVRDSQSLKRAERA